MNLNLKNKNIKIIIESKNKKNNCTSYTNDEYSYVFKNEPTEITNILNKLISMCDTYNDFNRLRKHQDEINRGSYRLNQYSMR